MREVSKERMARKAFPQITLVPSLAVVASSAFERVPMLKFPLIPLLFLWPWPLREVNLKGTPRNVLMPVILVTRLVTAPASVSENSPMLKIFPIP